MANDQGLGEWRDRGAAGGWRREGVATDRRLTGIGFPSEMMTMLRNQTVVMVTYFVNILETNDYCISKE